MFSWFPCARATDAAEVDARFAERGARKYVAKLTPKEQLVHREMAGFPPLVALRATFQHADPRARGTIDGGDFLFLLGIHRDAYAERLLERLDADADGELRLVECVVELARLDESRDDDDDVAFAFAFALFDVDGDGLVDAREVYAHVAAEDGRVVANLHRFRERLAREYPSSLDEDAFRRLAGRYPSLVEPAYETWSKIEALVSAAAVLAANLARRGYREFDVHREFDARESRRARTRRRQSFASPAQNSHRDGSEASSDEDASDASPTMSPTMTPRLFAEVSRRNDAYDRARRTNGTVVAAALAEAKRAERTAAERRRARRRALAARDESEHLSEQRELSLWSETRSRVVERTRSESPKSLELESLASASRLGDKASASARLKPPTRPREGWDEDPDATCDTRDTRDTRGGWSATRDVSTFRATFLAASRRIRAVVRVATVSRARRSEAPLPPGEDARRFRPTPRGRAARQ